MPSMPTADGFSVTRRLSNETTRSPRSRSALASQPPDEAARAGDERDASFASAGSESQTCQGAWPPFQRSLRTTASL